MEPEGLPKDVLNYRPAGIRRDTGRPRIRWS
jgi:hypothetical protein